jgi:hypothetical protein
MDTPQTARALGCVKKQFSLPVVIMVSHQDVQDETQIEPWQEIFLVAPMAGVIKRKRHFKKTSTMEQMHEQLADVD